MLVMFLLGFFLDFIEIIFVVVPLVGPVLLGMGVDPVWLGVMMAINLQTSFLTPLRFCAFLFARGGARKRSHRRHLSGRDTFRYYPINHAGTARMDT